MITSEDLQIIKRQLFDYRETFHPYANWKPDNLSNKKNLITQPDQLVQPK